MIEANEVQVRFKTKTGFADAVRSATFHVDEGEVFGLVGESGSGKSTVLRALTGLVPIANGSMRIGRHTLGKHIDRAFRREVQMVSLVARVAPTRAAWP